VLDLDPNSLAATAKRLQRYNILGRKLMQIYNAKIIFGKNVPGTGRRLQGKTVYLWPMPGTLLLGMA